MRTQVMLDRAVGLPWLERVSGEGGEPERIPIPACPFTLGRNESCDLPILSTRVSREHAEILCSSGKYRIRDLGSTNGTFVNGERIEDAALNDGDILVIADTELTFYQGRTESAERDNATLVMTHDRGIVSADSATEIILGVRRWQEAIVHRALECAFEPIVRLDDGGVFGYELVGDDESTAPLGEADRLLLATECRASTRLRWMRRAVAVEEADVLEGSLALFVRLDGSEIGSAGLVESVRRLRDATARRHRLVVEVPDNAVSDTPYYREFVMRLRDLGVLLAHDGFAAGPSHLTRQVEIRPDFIKPARSMLRGIEQTPDRRRQTAALVEAARSIGCEVIVAGLRTPAEEAACREAGCRFAQGELYRGLNRSV